MITLPLSEINFLVRTNAIANCDGVIPYSSAIAVYSFVADIVAFDAVFGDHLDMYSGYFVNLEFSDDGIILLFELLFVAVYLPDNRPPARIDHGNNPMLYWSHASANSESKRLSSSE